MFEVFGIFWLILRKYGVIDKTTTNYLFEVDMVGELEIKLSE